VAWVTGTVSAFTIHRITWRQFSPGIYHPVDFADFTGFGLNDNSHQFVMRWGVSREITGFGSMVSRLFGGRK